LSFGRVLENKRLRGWQTVRGMTELYIEPAALVTYRLTKNKETGVVFVNCGLKRFVCCVYPPDHPLCTQLVFAAGDIIRVHPDKQGSWSALTDDLIGNGPFKVTRAMSKQQVEASLCTCGKPNEHEARCASQPSIFTQHRQGLILDDDFFTVYPGQYFQLVSG